MANIWIDTKEQLVIEDPPFNGANMTNRVLEQMAQTTFTYYCPAYLRIKIKNFT